MGSPALRCETKVRSALPRVSGYLTTRFSILFGTWITFSISLSSICLRTELLASAAALTESSSAPIRQMRRARNLPLTCTATVTSFSALLSGSKSGHGAFKTNSLLPRACHSSRSDYIVSTLTHFLDTAIEWQVTILGEPYSVFLIDLFRVVIAAAVSSITARVNHTLVEQALKRLHCRNQSAIVEHFMPEACI